MLQAFLPARLARAACSAFLAGTLALADLASAGAADVVVPAPAPSQGATASGSVTAGETSVLYTAGVDEGSGCAPYLDAPIYPVSFPSGNNGFQLWLNVVSPANDGKNYWIKGKMDAKGDVTSPLRVDCKPTLASAHDPDGDHYRGSQWLVGFTKAPNGSLYGLVHDEYYGGGFPHGFAFSIAASPNCAPGVAPGRPVNPFKCTYATLSMAVMPKGESVFHLLGDGAEHVVARPAFKYVPDAGHPTGYFTNTNIVKSADGAYYALTVEMLPDGSQKRCPIRTTDIANASAWRGWGGSGYSADLPRGADCVTVGFSIFPFYLGYNTFFHKYIMVGAHGGASGPGEIAYALSSDLVHWSSPVSFGVPIFQKPTADWGRNNYPSLMDPAFLAHADDVNASVGAITGQTPWLIFVQHEGARGTRVVAIPVSFAQP